MIDIAVVGSGMGGAMIGALNKERAVVFEKDKNLGGCACSFERFNHTFNAGATTLVGYEEGMPLKQIFDKIGFVPQIEQSSVAIATVQKGKVLHRGQDFEAFLEELNAIYPHPNNRLFWEKIRVIDATFWQVSNTIYFAKYSLSEYAKSAKGALTLLRSLGLKSFKSAHEFINRYLPNISQEYLNFIDAALMITIQTTSKESSLLNMALGLSYPFHKVYYTPQGMGKIFEQMLKDTHVKRREEIVLIERHEDYYLLYSKKERYKAKNVVLNLSVFANKKLFSDEAIQKYYAKFGFHDQSAFVLYLVIKTDETFLHHYQIILERYLPESISNSFFVSFLKLESGLYSVTISTHTKALMWKNLSKERYAYKKEALHNALYQAFLEQFQTLKKDAIIHAFSATPTTFKRYTNRLNCGGYSINPWHLFSYPTTNTPFKGLYNIGDTLFSSQGWLGVSLGVNILDRQLNASR